MVSLNVLKAIESVPRVTVKGLEYVGTQIAKHPVESAIIGGSLAALGIGAVFTGGADLAAAPEVVAGESAALGGEAAAAGIGDAAAGASAAAADAAGAGVAADAGAAASDAAATGTESIARSAGGTFINGLAKGAATAVKYGLPLGAIGIGAEYLSAGIADVEQSLLTGTVPYQENPTQLLGGGSGIIGSSQGVTSVSSPGGGILSSSLGKILLLVFGGVVLYEVVKRK